ncbi:hypothetical protein [Actinopolymorpha cephalotaxi]|uniref:Secreted protein n=1 Tax=Actinopolymorpha cephalotaxi TaxID=504797 RepID=A0ABX2SDP0_9ACTN|nr:hypothetical protein [Actinopolymorpha cephalotaxi]NYH86657.1 hypothetical protein [Actinopolymorpha cephalotaxi]
MSVVVVGLRVVAWLSPVCCVPVCRVVSVVVAGYPGRVVLGWEVGAVSQSQVVWRCPKHSAHCWTLHRGWCRWPSGAVQPGQWGGGWAA